MGSKGTGKWVDGLAPEQPVVEAARDVLKVRLKAVQHHLPLAHRAYARDDEHVHQLRVATRRADAAIRAFRDYAKKGRRSKVRRSLREIRRAAGAARVCDVHQVLLVRLHDTLPPEEQAALDMVISWNRLERRDAQDGIARVARRYPKVMLKAHRKKLLKGLRTPPEAALTLGELAATTLPAGLAAMRDAIERDLSCYENLHELRITGKRLRYSMEIFRCCFDDRFDDVYARVESVQEELGEINDVHEIAQRLEAFARSRSTPGGRSHTETLPVIANLTERCLEQRAALGAAFAARWSAESWTSLFDAILRSLGGDGARGVASGPETLALREPT